MVNLVSEVLVKKYPNVPPAAFVKSFGCQQNTADAEKIKGVLAVMGYIFTENLENADIVVYNTCAIRETAESKVFGIIGELKRLKAKNPDLVIAICGCMVQQPQIAEKIRESYKQVDIIFGTFQLGIFPMLLLEVLTKRNKVCNISEKPTLLSAGIKAVRDDKFKASVSISYGCDNFCSYCIVPYVRGQERSRASAEIISEVKELILSGYKEVMLLGQNVNSYGKGLNDDINFIELLRQLNDLEGDFKIRFMSSHPKDASYELIDTILQCNKVCNHLHLPVQSGSNRILLEMNRKYLREQYLDIINYARNKHSGFSFSSDIIIGFPNETDEDFLMTKDLVETVKFNNLYTFIYSSRSGTKAAAIKDLTPHSSKVQRMTELLAVQRKISSDINKKYIGKTIEVLTEGINNKGLLIGKNEEYINVQFVGNESDIGKYVNVKVTDSHNWGLVGKI